MHLKDIDIDKVGHAIFKYVYESLASSVFNENDIIKCFTPITFSDTNKYEDIYKYPEYQELLNELKKVINNG